jgi:hypothetical protein
MLLVSYFMISTALLFRGERMADPRSSDLFGVTFRPPTPNYSLPDVQTLADALNIQTRSSTMRTTSGLRLVSDFLRAPVI